MMQSNQMGYMLFYCLILSPVLPYDAVQTL